MKLRKQKKYLYIMGGGVILVVLLVFGLLTVNRFIRHERAQNARIERLEQLLIGQTPMAENHVEDHRYHYLAIGNSITQHWVTEFWWNEIGMAASEEDKDYVHLVASGLDQEDVDVVVLCYYLWEVQAADRAETYMILDPYLSPDLDLITIQLGENADDTATLEVDFEELLRHIQKACPKAKIVLIGEFWRDEAKDAAKRQAALNCGVIFVDLSEMWGYPEYQAGMNAIVYDREGNAHEITHQGVAWHPGDLGMARIAELVLESLK